MNAPASGCLQRLSPDTDVADLLADPVGCGHQDQADQALHQADSGRVAVLAVAQADPDDKQVQHFGYVGVARRAKEVGCSKPCETRPPRPRMNRMPIVGRMHWTVMYQICWSFLAPSILAASYRSGSMPAMAAR